MVDLIPRHADNDYRGQKAALWLFGLVVALRTLIALGSMFNGREAASGADGIPLPTYTAAGAQTVLTLFAMLGLARLLSSVVSFVVLVRYRSLVPLMFVLILVEQVGRRVILYFLPIVRTETERTGVVNLVLLSLIVAGVALSLWPRSGANPTTA